MDTIDYILIVIGSLIIILLILLFIVYRMVFYNEKKGEYLSETLLTGIGYDEYHEEMMDLVHKIIAKPYEDVYIKSSTGITLHGKLYLSKNPTNRLNIHFHGYKGDSMTDCSAGSLFSIDEEKVNTLLVDQRAHNTSGSRTITFGIKERIDCLDWVNYGKKRFGDDVKIMLFGLSMGASTVLMASNLDFGGNVKGIIADCPYDSPRGIIKKIIRDSMHLNDRFFIGFVKMAGLIFARFNIDKIDCIKAVKESKIPILIVHGKSDQICPYQMSIDIKGDNDNVTLLLVDNAYHGMSWFVNNKAYREAVYEFKSKLDL